MASPLISTLQKFWKPATHTALTAVTLLAVLFFGALFYLYVSQNYSYLVERNFRLLATWSTELKETVENYQKTFAFRIREQESEAVPQQPVSIRSRGARPILPEKGLMIAGFEEVPMELESTQKDAGSPLFYERRKTLMAENLKQLPYVQILRPAEQPSSPATQGESKPRKETPVTFSLVPNQSAGIVRANIDGQDTPIEAGFSLGTLIKNIATEKIFDDVILTDPTGTVIFQRNPSTLQFTHLSNLLHHQRLDTSWLSLLFQEGGVEQETRLDPDKLVQVMKSATPSHFQITVGGNSYDVFMQAIEFPQIALPGQQAGSGTPWIICGVLPSSDFQEQYLAIPFTVLLVCLFLLISAFLALPFLSLLMMNARERLTRFSVVTLLVTQVLAAGIGTLFLMDLGLYRHMASDFHERLEHTAQAISETVQAQLDRMLWQLIAFDEKMTALGDLKTFPEDPTSNAWLARYHLPSPCLQSSVQQTAECYPDFSVAFWVDPQGNLRETWTQGDEPYVRGIHDLRHRDYVSKLQQPSSHPLYRRFVHHQWIDYYAQPLISLESSTRSLVLSIPHHEGGQNSPNVSPKGWIAAIQSESFSLLSSPVLSSEAGFAVVDDRSGLVLFHSNARRMLRENFLEETDSNAEIGALIYARAEGSVEGDYWGVGHRFFVKPLAGLPWTLVVFESKEAFRTINFDILIFSLCLFTLYILTVFIWIVCLSHLYRYDAAGRRVRWTWPKLHSRSLYHWLSLGQGGLFLVSLVVLGLLDWKENLPLAYRLTLTCLPFFMIWFVIRVLWKQHPATPTRTTGVAEDPWTLLQSSQLLGAFSRFVLSSVLLVGVFPALLFFKVAHDQEMRLFAQHHLWDFSQALTAQTKGVWLAKGTGETREKFTYSDHPSACLFEGCLNAANPSSSTLPFQRCRESSSFSVQSVWHTTMQGLFPMIPLSTCVTFATQNWEDQNILSPSLFDRLPQFIRQSSLQNPMNKESWGFLHHTPSDSQSEWAHTVRDGRQRVGLRIKTFLEDSIKEPRVSPLHLSVSIGLFPWNLSIRFLGFLLFGGLLVAVSYWVLRYIAGKIYPLPSFFHRSHELGSGSQGLTAAAPPHLLILGSPGSGKSQLIQQMAAECCILDLHQTFGKETWAADSLASIPQGTRAVILDHFEYRWEEPRHRQETGRLLEHLLAGKYRVCLLSTRDPLEWTKGPWVEPGDRSQEAVQAYWVDLLGTFVSTHFVPSRMESLLREWLSTPSELTLPVGSPSTLAVKSCLIQESQPTLQLTRIGYWIRSFQEWATWTPSQMKEQFLHVSWPYYLSLWQSCTLSEKLALYHLSLDGYLHADNPDLTSLSQRGLIRLAPDLQIMNDSFRQFVLRLGNNLHLSQWEKQATQDTWGRLKWPFLMFFGTIILFFFFTQQEFKNSFITLMSLLPILLPAIPELPFLSSQSKASSPPSS